MVQFFKRWFHHYTLDKAKREMKDDAKCYGKKRSFDDAVWIGLGRAAKELEEEESIYNRYY
ncbi:hypothetical protein AB4472_09455 [Vibrio lentus]